MRVCAVTKYPPIQGGVSARSYWIAHALARRGHQVHVVTNAGEVEAPYRIWVPPEDHKLLEASFANGGRVTVVGSGTYRKLARFVPQSNPYVTKLASMATEVIRRERCEVLFSFYYEPYGLSGHLAASWTNVPHVVQHAGSDRGRLMNHPELSLAYREMLRRASIVVTRDRALEGLGIPGDRVARAAVNFLPQHFTPDAPPLDVDALVSRTARHPFVRNPAPWRGSLATFGVLGKVGEAKGSYDLIEALARVRARGWNFNLLATVGGAERDRFLEAIDAHGLGSSTWTLPLLPHWRVPAALRACTAVCFLERGFPIAAHRPGVPQEILACGVCAVLSREIADKQHFRDRLRHGQHAFVVEDPSDASELAGVLEGVVRDPDRARAIGKQGTSLVKLGDADELGRTYERLLQAAVELQGRRPDVPVTDVRAFLAGHAPDTVRLMAQEIDDAFSRWGAELSRSHASAPLIAYHLIDRLAARHPDAEYLQFERDLLWLTVDLEGPNGNPEFPPRPSRALAGSPRRRDGLVPVRSNWVRMAKGPASGDEPTSYVLQKRGDLIGRAFRAGRATRELLRLCDGSRTVEQIDAELGEHGIDMRGRTAETVDRLVREGLLDLR